MKINYSLPNTSFFFYPLYLGKQHLAIASMSSINRCVRSHIPFSSISSPSKLSLKKRVYHFLVGILEMLPILGHIVALADKLINSQSRSVARTYSKHPKKIVTINPPPFSNKLQQAIIKTPEFQGYCMKRGNNNIPLTGLSVRPANLFFDALGDTFQHTRPGSNLLFRFISPHKKIRQFIKEQPNDHIVRITAKTKMAKVKKTRQAEERQINLERVFGKKQYEISFKEIKGIIQSHSIYINSLVPKPFILGLKKAFAKDNIVALPGSDRHPLLLKEFLQKDTTYAHTKHFLENVARKPFDYGFNRKEKMFSFDELLSLTIYQIGAMIVKTEKYHCFIGNNYAISNRKVGDKDDLLLISTCGIRGFSNSTKIDGNKNHEIDYLIDRESNKAVFAAVGNGGYLVACAKGLGVWRGDPEVYWKSFLDALVQSPIHLGKILINPRHQKTRRGKYTGYDGKEFGFFLKKYRKKYPNNKNLANIINLYEEKSDILLLAKNVKKKYPDRVVGLINASDPDVTLGGHIGEYTNNMPHGVGTTEEHYAAAGTSCLNFEGITAVLEESSRRVYQMV